MQAAFFAAAHCLQFVGLFFTALSHKAIAAAAVADSA